MWAVSKMVHILEKNLYILCFKFFDTGLRSRGLNYSFIHTWGSDGWSYASWLVQSCKAATKRSYVYLSSNARNAATNPDAATGGEEGNQGEGVLFNRG